MDEPTQSGLCTPRLADDPAISLDDSAPDCSVTGRPQPTQACMLPLPCPTQLNPSRHAKTGCERPHELARATLVSRRSPLQPYSKAQSRS
jgi:hypothetical protein